MLGLTELDNVVCRHLDRGDLFQCVLVSKRWSSIAIPHLWHDVSWVSSHHSYMNKKAFCRMVREDYLAEQRNRELQQKESGIQEPSRSQSSLPSSTLSKYGHWIRRLSDLDDLEGAFRMSTPFKKDGTPTPHELLHHLLKRCSPQMQVGFMTLNLDELGLDSDNHKKMVLDFCLPRLRHLLVQGDIKSSSSGTQDLADLMDLLDRHTISLEILKPDVEFSSARINPVEDQTVDGLKSWTLLEQLSLSKCIGNEDISAFLSRLLKKCTRMKGLHVNDCSEIAQTLLEGMLNHLPNLDEITFGDEYYGTDNTRDDIMAQLLSGSTKGWRMATFCSNVRFGEAAMDALTRHFSTLETLYMDGCDGVTSNHLVQALGSCPYLHTLSNVYWHFDSIDHSPIDAKVFIDKDPDIGSLRPWQCETSLKVFKARITGIPRPDLKEDGAAVEAYLGQARQLHAQVYDRLARLINLEKLWLGNQCVEDRSDCLEMSLRSGLGKLSGLSKLRELDVTRIHTRIGVKEVQWMSQHWPRLRTIYGLCDEENKEALRWLHVGRPDIEVK